MKIQCLYYALDKWNETGGYILFRKSTHWCIPHVLHLNPKTNEITHYIPPENLKYPWYSMFGFEGYIKKGDLEPTPPIHPLCIGIGSVALLVLGFVWMVKRNTIRKNRRRHERRAGIRTGGSDRRRY